MELTLSGTTVPLHLEYLVYAHELDTLWDQATKYPSSAFAAIREAGLKAAPRLSNPPWGLSSEWLQYSPDLVILGGVESPGYPRNLADYASRLAELDARVGVVEFAQQKGVERLAPPERMVRVHGINQREMEVLDAERITARYLRAAKERNIRVLYLRPILTGEDPWTKHCSLGALTNELQSAGLLSARVSHSLRGTYRLGRHHNLVRIWAGAALLSSRVRLPGVVFLGAAGLGFAVFLRPGSAQLDTGTTGHGPLGCGRLSLPCLPGTARPLSLITLLQHFRGFHSRRVIGGRFLNGNRVLD